MGFIVLWVVLAVVVCLLAVCVVRTLRCKPDTKPAPAPDMQRAQEYAQKLSKMVQKATVSRRGDEDIARFEEFHALLAQLYPTVFTKLEKTDLDGSLLLKWQGAGKAKPILIMSHMDVVEASAEGWSHPPFGGEIADGAVWGRGAMDTKCSLLGFMQAAEELLQSGFVPDGDIYLASGCTEEIGGSGGPKIVAHLKEKGVHLGMVLDEGGGVIDNAMAGLPGKYAMIALGEKGYGDVKFTAKSAGGHASTPPKNTPLVRLGKFMADCEKHNPFRRVLGTGVRATFAGAAPNAPFGLRLIFCNLWLFGPLFKAILPAMNSSGEALLQTTIAFTMAKGSDGYNVIPTEASVCANMRFAPHQNMDESLQIIKARAAKFDIEMQPLQCNAASPVLDMNGPAYKQVAALAKQIFPEATVAPFYANGCTDARFYKDITDHTVRFAPIVLNKQQFESMHGLNENIGVADIPRTVDFYKQVMQTVKL